MHMKRFFFILIFSHPFVGYTQNAANSTSYEEQKDNLYREGGKLSAYMKQRCRLDLYYPKNKTGFGTIVWFHGGGLKAAVN